MALALRTLLGDDDRLIDRVLSIKRSVLFFDSAADAPAMPGKGRIGVGGLTVMASSGQGWTVEPRCLTGWVPVQHFLRFHEWWRRERPVQQNDLSVTREFVVHEVASTDGVHIEERLDADYATLSGPIAGITIGGPDGTQSPLSGVAQAAIRQIAWEVDRTLIATLSLLPEARRPESE